jgi:hypothetical protein
MPDPRRLGRCLTIVLWPLLLIAAVPTTVLADDDGRGGGGWGWEGAGSQQKGWVQGWGTGSVAAQVRPGTTTSCDTSHQCEVTVSSSGHARATLGQIGQFTLAANLTVDFPDGTTNGFGGQCFPVTGVLSLTGAQGGAGLGTLVVDVQGTDCAVGSSTTLSTIDGTYVVDGANSTGKFAGAAGGGAVNATTDMSQSPPAVGFAFSGSLRGAGK